ncbi:MAG TPA: class I tRNA ligase family protein, partial [Atribacterota bacterium]|nr:class I tRNA ligase family protein [Atribacterota bacterium]
MDSMEQMSFNVALEHIWTLIRGTNKYIDQTEPWVLGKNKDKKIRLEQVLYNLAESLRIIAILIYPFMPVTAFKVWHQLGIEDALENMTIPEKTEWGIFKPGTEVNPDTSLFPRIEEEKKSILKKI